MENIINHLCTEKMLEKKDWTDKEKTMIPIEGNLNIYFLLGQIK